MKKILFLLCFLLSSSWINPQDIETIINEINKLREQGEKYYKTGEYDKALVHYEKALSLAEQLHSNKAKYPDDFSAVVAAHSNAVGEILFLQYRYEEAVLYFQKSLAQKLKTPNHHAQANYYLASIFNSYGNFSKALEYGKISLNQLQQLGTSPIPELACAYNCIGLSLQGLCRYDESIESIEEALKQIHHLVDPPKLHIATFYTNLGQTYQLKGDMNKGMEYYQKALSQFFAIDTPTESHIAKLYIAKLYHYIGANWRRQGNYEKAIEYYKISLEDRQKLFRSPNPELGESYNGLGVALSELGRKEEALEVQKKALKEFMGVYTPPHFSFMSCYKLLGSLYRDLGKEDESLDCYAKSIEQARQLFKEPHEFIANMYTTMADTQAHSGLYSAAEKKYRLALSQYLQLHTSPHENIARTYLQLGGVLSSMGRYEEALKLQLDGQKQLVDLYPKVHHQIAVSHSEVGLSYYYMKDYPKAWKSFLHCFDMREIMFAREWPVLSNLDKINRIPHHFYTPNSIFLTLCADSPTKEYLSKAFETSLYGKGLVTRVLTQEQAIRNLTSDATLSKVHDEYKQTVLLLNHLSYQPALSEKEQEEIKKLRLRKEDIEREISKISKNFPQLLTIKRNTLEDIQKILPKNSVLLEYIEFHYLKYDEKWIGVFIVKPQQIEFIPLGSLQKIEKLVYKIRQRLDDDYRSFSDIMSHSTEKAAKNFLMEQELSLAQVSSELRKIIWPRVLEDELLTTSLIFLAPDAALHYLPFGMLALDEDSTRYLVEDYDLVYVTSGASLLRTYVEEGQGLFAVGNPDYDLSSNEKSKLLASLKYKTRSLDSTNTTLEQLQNTKWSKLQWGQREIRSIQGWYKSRYPNDQIIVHEKEEALETSFCTEASGKRWIHVATHGYFLGAGDNLIGEKTPLMLSGLVMAGANSREKLDQSQIDDGFLTASDIALLNLKGTKCVVLSCCETGMGKYLSGVGIFSFKWAFEYAGARYLLVSLWKIPDQETLVLMNKFYAKHSFNLKVWKALLESQRSYIREHRQDGKSHPYFWAAFICQGNPLPLVPESNKTLVDEKIPEKRLILEPDKIALAPEESIQFTAMEVDLQGTQSSAKNIRWEVTPVDAATVTKSGTVTTHKTGKCTIRVSSDNAVSAEAELSILPEIKLDILDIHDRPISAEKIELVPGEKIELKCRITSKNFPIQPENIPIKWEIDPQSLVEFKTIGKQLWITASQISNTPILVTATLNNVPTHSRLAKIKSSTHLVIQEAVADHIEITCKDKPPYFVGEPIVINIQGFRKGILLKNLKFSVSSSGDSKLVKDEIAGYYALYVNKPSKVFVAAQEEKSEKYVHMDFLVEKKPQNQKSYATYCNTTLRYCISYPKSLHFTKDPSIARDAANLLTGGKDSEEFANFLGIQFVIYFYPQGSRIVNPSIALSIHDIPKRFGHNTREYVLSSARSLPNMMTDFKIHREPTPILVNGKEFYCIDYSRQSEALESVNTRTFHAAYVHPETKMSYEFVFTDLISDYPEHFRIAKAILETFQIDPGNNPPIDPNIEYEPKTETIMDEFESIEGDIYNNKKHGFEIKKYGITCKFITKKAGLDKLNETASVALVSETGFITMVIVEAMPKIDLYDYVNMVAPGAANRKKIYEKKFLLNGINVVKIKWSGDAEGETFHYYYTFAAYKDWRYQIMTCCTPDKDNEDNRKLITAIEDSFRINAKEVDISAGVEDNKISEIGNSVEENTFQSENYGFKIKKPENWRFLYKGKGLEELRKDACIGMFNGQNFCYLLVEKLPNMDIHAYSKMVAPDLNNRIQLYEKEINKNDNLLLKIKWAGDIDGDKYHFYYTFAKSENFIFQIICTSPSDSANQEILLDITFIEDSFTITEESKQEAVSNKKIDLVEKEESITGNLYKNMKYGFQVIKPDDNWIFIRKGEGLESFNEDACIGLVCGNDVWSMIMVEDIPGIDLATYSQITKPDLNEIVKEYEKKEERNGRYLLKVKWTGKLGGEKYSYHKTFVRNDRMVFQMVCCYPDKLNNKKIQNDIASIEDNFGFLKSRPDDDIKSERIVIAKDDLITENIYQNKKYRFQIQKPNDQWVFLTKDQGATSINPLACVAILNESDICTMVIVEKVPEVDLIKYISRVGPKIEQRTKLYEKKIEKNNILAVKSKWAVVIGEERVYYYYTCVAQKEFFYQIVSFCAEKNDSEELQRNFAEIEDSFRFLTDSDQ
ncbi:MAG: CHAT domain-containing protein [Candidatus Brocadiae bacterium]|nr:CHAT domain-containing protein [Candidatus Brocadiia bacterium]